MFAVLKTGGKQYKVSSGDVLRVEKLAAVAGETVQFNEILMVGDRVGEPFVQDAGVQAEVIDQIKDKKVIHFVKRRRKHGSKRTKGHRQRLTLLRVTEILESGAVDSGVKAAVGAGSVSGAWETKAQDVLTDSTVDEQGAAEPVEDKAPVTEEDRDDYSDPVAAEKERIDPPDLPQTETSAAVEHPQPQDAVDEAEDDSGTVGISLPESADENDGMADEHDDSEDRAK